MEQSEYRSYRAVHPFDERFGVDTSGLVYELPSGHQHDPYNNGYFAVAPSVFHSVMRALRDRLELDYRRFRFVDVGSGKGRALLLACGLSVSRDHWGRALSGAGSHRPGQHRALSAAARHRAPVSSIQGDAAEFRGRPCRWLIYMWNSFTGPVMERVFRNLEASLAQCRESCTWSTYTRSWK